MEPRSQLAAGRSVQIGAGVRRIVAPNAGLMTGPGTNTYLLGEREIAVIDPGPDNPAHLRAILEASAAPIRWVIVTHTHGDHSPLAAVLAKQTGARLIGLSPPNDGRQDESFVPEQRPGDGERMVLGDVALTAIHTPGHASNCVCYLLEAERMVFTGDHVLEGVSPVILPPDGDMSEYMHSLEKLLVLDVEKIAPGHGGIMTDAKHVIEALRRHRLAREDKITRAMADAGPVTLEHLTPIVYNDVPQERHAWARLTLAAHLIKLARDGRVLEHEGVWQLGHA